MPFKATAITAAAGYTAWGAAELAGLVAGTGGHLIATTATGAMSAAVVGVLRLTYRAGIGARWRSRFWCAGAGASAWVTLVSIDGAGWGLLAALTTGAAAVSAGWLRAHEVPVPDVDEQPAVPELASTTTLKDIAGRWAREVAGNPKLAPGCRLTEGRQLDNRLAFTLELASGFTISRIRGLQEGIAAAMRLDPMQLTFDLEPPGENGFVDSSRVATQVILRSPITGPVFYTQPRYEAGRITLGPYIDAEGHGAAYELFRSSGMFSGVVIGSTGYGKSGLVNGLVTSARSSGMTFCWYLDPKGNSSPDLARHATVAELGLDRAEAFTRAAETLVRYRGKAASAAGSSAFTPTRKLPGALIVIDECDMLFALQGMADRWGAIAKTGRSLGVGLLLATQYAGLKAFGNSELLRSSVRAGNVVLMRTESSTSDQLIAPDLPKSTTLPTRPGYAYIKNAISRAAAFRSAWLLTSDEPVPAAFPAELAGWNADAALARYPDAPMDPIAAKAATILGGGDGLSREERQARNTERLERELADFLGAPLAAPANTATAAAGPAAASVLAGFGARFAALPGPLAPVVPLRQPPAEPTPLAGEFKAEALAGLSDAQRAVLAALADGHTRSGSIVERTGLAAATVSRALATLAERGLATRQAHGEWAATDAAGAA